MPEFPRRRAGPAPAAVFGPVGLAVIKEGDPRHAYVNFNTVEEAAAAAGAQFVDLNGTSAAVARPGHGLASALV